MSKLFGIPVGVRARRSSRPCSGSRSASSPSSRARNRVFFRLGVRNARRRPGRTALIVAGSMLGTAIIAAALATGDTMSQTIRSSAVSALGRADEVVAARGVDAPLAADRHRRDRRALLPAGATPAASRARRPRPGSSTASRPVIVEPVAVQDVTTRQNEPRVTLFASESRALRALRRRCAAAARTVSLAELRAGRGLPQREGRRRASAPAPATRCACSPERAAATVRVRDVVQLPRRRHGRRGPAHAARRGAAAARQAGPGQARASSRTAAAPARPTRVIARLAPDARARSGSRPTTASRTRSRRPTSRAPPSCRSSRRSARSRSPRASC